MTKRSALLLAELDTHDSAGATWLGDWLREQLDACVDPLRLRVVFARLARKLSDPRACQLARMALVLAALERDDDPALVVQLFRAGELAEQSSVLCMLPELPDAARFTELAIEACRTNAVPVFTAIAHDNPFPAAYFPAPAFNQMVLKALFLGLQASPIIGLAERATPELRRMVESYADERRAAGRSVPDDVALIQRLCEHGRSPGDAS